MPQWTDMNAPPAPLPAPEHQVRQIDGPLLYGPHRHRRTRIYYVLTVAPAAGAVGTPVEETCDRCGEHADTGAIVTATGEPVRAGRQYSAPAGGAPARKTRAYHVDDKQIGSRTGLRYPGGTETWKAYKVEWTDQSAPGDTWVSMGDEKWSEKPPIVTQIPSYILWNDPPAPVPCNLDEAFGVVFQEELAELYASASTKPAKPVRGEPVPA